MSREVNVKEVQVGRWQSLASGKVKGSEGKGVFREGVEEDVSGSGGVFLSLSALNCPLLSHLLQA